LPHFIEASRLDTNYLEARFNMGNAYLAVGQTNSATAAFQDVLRLRADFAPAAKALSRLQGSLK
jgi:tetratricopeptide (TPR) repeat protein